MRQRWTDAVPECAKSRYDIDLTDLELHEIWRQCHDGEAFCGFIGPLGNSYIVEIRGVRLVPMLSQNGEFIVTFMDGNTFTAGHRKKFYKALGRVKQCEAAPNHMPRPYKRENFRVADVYREEP